MPKPANVVVYEGESNGELWTPGGRRRRRRRRGKVR
jgi:hypothetical protein